MLKAQETGANVIGLSALISLAVSKMAETVSLLREGGFGGRVIVGRGGRQHGRRPKTIGADAHAADAWEALRRVRDLAKPGTRASAEGGDRSMKHDWGASIGAAGDHAMMGGTPDRVPLGFLASEDIAARISGLSIREMLASPQKLADVSIEVCEVLGGDTASVVANPYCGPYEGLAFAAANGKPEAFQWKDYSTPFLKEGTVCASEADIEAARDPRPPPPGALAHDSRGHRHRGKADRHPRPTSHPASPGRACRCCAAARPTWT